MLLPLMLGEFVIATKECEDKKGCNIYSNSKELEEMIKEANEQSQEIKKELEYSLKEIDNIFCKLSGLRQGIAETSIEDYKELKKELSEFFGDEAEEILGYDFNDYDAKQDIDVFNIISEQIADKVAVIGGFIAAPAIAVLGKILSDEVAEKEVKTQQLAGLIYALMENWQVSIDINNDLINMVCEQIDEIESLNIEFNDMIDEVEDLLRGKLRHEWTKDDINMVHSMCCLYDSIKEIFDSPFDENLIREFVFYKEDAHRVTEKIKVIMEE